MSIVFGSDEAKRVVERSKLRETNKTKIAEILEELQLTKDERELLQDELHGIDATIYAMHNELRELGWTDGQAN